MNDVIKMINEKYDIREDYSAKIELPFDYQEEYRITAIIGGSGTGKTTLLRKWFNVENTSFNMELDNPIFEILYSELLDFEETCKLLFDVGLSSVPTWKNSYSQLSNGEKLRFEIAYKLISMGDIIFIDEFTSMLDRQVAKNLAFNIEKLVHKYAKNIVLCTAHYDVLDWVKVDRLVDTTLKKSHSPQIGQHVTHTQWKLETYHEICGEFLSNITI